MLKKIAFAFGLTIVAGAGFAADNAPTGINIGINSPMPVAAQFDALDSNDDGAISRVEAQASPELCALYDGFDTKETIETGAPSAGVPGITRAQFSAGLQALGEGALGPAVSGGGIDVTQSNGEPRCADVIEKPVRAY